MGYRLCMSGEIHDWLADLHETDPSAAMLVGQALAALMSEGASPGPPLVVPVAGRADRRGAVCAAARVGARRRERPRRDPWRHRDLSPMTDTASPVPAPAAGAQAPPVSRAIYGMPMFATLLAHDLAATVSWVHRWPRLHRPVHHARSGQHT